MPDRHAGVLVADDDPQFCALLTAILEDAGFSVETAGNADDAFLIAATAAPSVAVLDVDLAGRSGYELCRDLRRRFGTDLAIVFLSGARTESYDRAAGMLLGADDYFGKPFDPDELVDCIRGHVERLGAHGRRQLTPREREVLALLAGGLAQDAIAEQLGISARTVATHIDRILMKLGVHSRAQAVAAAYRETAVA